LAEIPRMRCSSGKSDQRGRSASGDLPPWISMCSLSQTNPRAEGTHA
jgi:hypothetical protein